MPFTTINPFNEQTIAHYPFDAHEMLDKKLHILSHADRWSLSDKQSQLNALSHELEKDIDTLAVMTTTEMGKPITESRAEIKKCAWLCRHYASLSEEDLADIPLETQRYKSLISYQPLGVILAIMPWNFPYWQIMRAVVPNFLLGNPVLVKPALNTAGCSQLLERSLHQFEAFTQFCQFAFLSNDDTAKLISDPRISAVTLTGSTRAGRRVAALAGQAIKKTVLELGGNDPYIILKDADLNLAAIETAHARLLNAGQSCIAAKRIIVEKAVYDDFLERLKQEFAKVVLDDPHKEQTTMGPLARQDLKDHLIQQREASLHDGAQSFYQHPKDQTPAQGYFFAPEILIHVHEDHLAFRDEFFGPLACITQAEDEKKAIALANASPFGLGACLFSQDLDKAEYMAKYQIQAGMVFVNEMVKSDPRLPFGGIKESGYGRELARQGLLAFANEKTICIQKT